MQNKVRDLGRSVSCTSEIDVEYEKMNDLSLIAKSKGLETLNSAKQRKLISSAAYNIYIHSFKRVSIC